MSKERLTGTKMKGVVDHTAARELFLFIQNDSYLYRQEQAIDKNLRAKLKRGIFDKALAVKLFMYLADAGAAKYIKDYNSSYYSSRTHSMTTYRIDTMFSKKTRFAVAAMLTKYWIDARRNDGVHINPQTKRAYCQLCGRDGELKPVHLKNEAENSTRWICSQCYRHYNNAGYLRPVKNPHHGTWTQPFNVYLDGKWIERVYFTVNTSIDEVKRSLVNHDGMDPRIVVKRGRLYKSSRS